MKARIPRSALLGLVAVLSFAAAGCVGTRERPSVSKNLDIGETELAAGGLNAAEEAFRQVLADQPRQPEALLGLARVELARGDGDSALRWLSQLELADEVASGSEAQTLHCRALQLATERALEEPGAPRAPALARAVARPPCQHPQALEMLARAHIEAARRARVEGRPEEAMAHYRTAISSDPDAVDAVLGAAELLLAQGDRDGASEILSEALLRQPRNQRMLQLMVEVLGAR